MVQNLHPMHQNFYIDNKISHQFTPTYMPQQNCVVECKSPALVKSTYYMFQACALHSSFEGEEVMKTTNYIQNCLTTNARKIRLLW